MLSKMDTKFYNKIRYIPIIIHCIIVFLSFWDNLIDIILGIILSGIAIKSMRGFISFYYKIPIEKENSNIQVQTEQKEKTNGFWNRFEERWNEVLYMGPGYYRHAKCSFMILLIGYIYMVGYLPYDLLINMNKISLPDCVGIGAIIGFLLGDIKFICEYNEKYIIKK